MSLKILHVVNSLEPGGMENGVVNIAQALAQKGITNHVACLERRGAFADRLPKGSEVFLLGKTNGFSLAAAWQLSRLIGRVRPAIVHSHNLGALIYSGLATVGGWRRVLVHGEHSQLTDDERQPRRLRQRRIFYGGCRLIHTVSAAMRKELILLGFPAKKITDIANGVDIARFTPTDHRDARIALSLPPDALAIGIVGRFGPFKRHLQLIEAFEQVAPRFPKARLLIIGGGGSEESAASQRAKESILRSRIHLLGFQPDPRPCYQALDLLVIPSVNEGFSNVALEAMACGVPALVRADCGHEQLISHGVDGWIEAFPTSTALAARLGEILAEPARLVDFGRNARKKVAGNFSLESMTAAYEDLYRACAPR